jgi:hypothetical protein
MHLSRQFGGSHTSRLLQRCVQRKQMSGHTLEFHLASKEKPLRSSTRREAGSPQDKPARLAAINVVYHGDRGPSVIGILQQHPSAETWSGDAAEERRRAG